MNLIKKYLISFCIKYISSFEYTISSINKSLNGFIILKALI